MSQLFHVEQSAKTSDDYLTPAWVFDALGLTFDLDVASPPWETYVPALRKFTKADDGLSQPWEGRVWMNPPFSNTAPWVSRFIEHRHGIALVPASNGLWFGHLWEAADGIAVHVARVYFESASGGPRDVNVRTIFAAFGDECVAALGSLGRIR